MKKITLQDLEFLLILLEDMPTGVTSDLNDYRHWFLPVTLTFLPTNARYFISKC